jgi:hypothetical protein
MKRKIESSTAPKPFVFVLMPFDPEFDDVYQLGIKPACNDAGAYAERVDEQIYQESILGRIYNQIAKADVIIADMSGRNPNVFYEVGYAHALGKHVVLLTHRAEDIPFDLKHYPHIVYEGRIRDLIPELKRRVKWLIEHPRKGVSAIPIQFYIHGKSLVDNPLILFEVKKVPTTSIDFKLDAHNSIASEIVTAKFQIGFITSERIGGIIERIQIEDFDKFKQPDGSYLFLDKRKLEILPGAWDYRNLALSVQKSMEFSESTLENIILRLFSETGTIDFPFKFGIKLKDEG